MGVLKRWVIGLLMCVLVVGCSWVAFRAGKADGRDAAVHRAVTISWGDGRHGPAFYGAHIYAVPDGEVLSVRARVDIGRGSNYWHDCGEMGRVASHEQAVAQFGTVSWAASELRIGSGGAKDYSLARAKLESHR